MTTQLQTKKPNIAEDVRNIENIIHHNSLNDTQRTLVLADMLAKMMHYCDEHQFNFWEIEDTAHEWYRRER